ncbi:MAG: glycosyltransferase family 4 protein [Bacilli bacterium]|nr:glycosyltransferase family 4 protein [Bacilli bacterium]
MYKICHITTTHERFDERIFYKECISLKDKGYEVFLIAKGESALRDGINIIGLGKRPENRIFRFLYFTKLAFKEAKRIDADIYHYHDPELLGTALKTKKMGKLVIFDSHEDIPMQIYEKSWIPSVFRGLISNFYRWYEKYVAKRIDAVISVTPSIVKKFSLVNEKSILITNYPRVNSNHEIKYVNNPNKGFKMNNICFAGGISEQWMHENILKSIEELNVKYVLIGSGEEKYLSKLKTLKGWEKVVYLGKIDHESVHNVLTENMLGLALNSYNANVGYTEGSLGNTKLFEYMLAGIPVICTDFILWKKIIDESKCGISVNPNNVQEIKAGISFIINNPKIALEMGMNGRKAILNKYNWNMEEEKLISLYRLILTKKS